MKTNILNKFILLFISTFLIQQICVADELNFVQATDTHLRGKSEQLTNFVKTINKTSNIDFVVFTGDNIDVANLRDLKEFLKEVKKIRCRKFVLIGNHDVLKMQGLDKSLYMKTVQHYLGISHSNKPHYVFIRKGIVFVVLDGTKQIIPASNGYFNDDELKWFDEVLTKYEDKKVVVLQHYPLLDTNIIGHELYAKDKYEEVLKRHNNVIAIIAGHYHKNIEQNIDGICHIVTPPLRNNYYKIITIDCNDYSVYTTLVKNE